MLVASVRNDNAGKRGVNFIHAALLFLRRGFQGCGKRCASRARMAMAARVVTMVTMRPTRTNSQKVIFVRRAASCRTIKFATELMGVALPANVLVLATASQTK